MLPALARLRADVGVELAGPAWELARLRARARPVFGPEADVLFFTADTLEQAGRPALAARRAARLLADGTDSVADLGCAAGTDTIALARAGARGARRRPRPGRPRADRRERRRPRAGRRRAWSSPTTPSTWSPARGGEVAGCGATVLDPARRAGGRRQLDPDRWSPPWSTVAALLDRVPRAAVKVAPGLDHDRVPEGIEAEWVSVGGSIVEARAVGARGRAGLAPGDARARRRTSWS